MAKPLVLLLALLQAPVARTPIERARDEVLAAGYAVGYAPYEPRWIAVYDLGTRTIYLNPRATYWDDPAAAQRALHASGQMSSASPKHILRHEMAHAELHRTLGTDRMNALGALLPRDADLVKREVGTYAATNCVEFCAEVAAGLKDGRMFSGPIMSQYAELMRPSPN